MNPRFWIAFLSTAAVLCVAAVNLDRTSPGPLATVHAREDLACADCHGGWFGTMTEACLACHEAVGDQIEASGGLHGALGSLRAQACSTCHTEHHGPDFNLVNRQSFVRAGIEDPGEFDHKLVGFEMDGRHRELTCVECHEHADDAVLPEGATRYMGLDQGCEKCHQDPHEGRMQLACARCHGQIAFDQLVPSDHDERLPLTGGHAEVSCRDCHEDLEAVGAGRTQEARTCLDCHESPHQTEFEESCGSCHRPHQKLFREPGLEISAAQHARTGFKLDAPHDERECRDCHAPEATRFSERYPGRKADDCVRCHKDPHAGQFKRGCIECHQRERFEPHAFSVEMHGKTATKLEHSHLEAECHACHKGEEPRVFAGTRSACAACHKDVHAGRFDATCAACHKPTHFRDLDQAAFDHSKWTGFAVKGAHAQSDCESCHPRTARPDETGRTFGRVKKFEGCVTCHSDPHQGGFKESAGCEECHAHTSFRAFPEGFSHGQWTGFPLQGKHSETGCASCHAPLRKADAHGRTWERARGRQCTDCHADPHARQFVIEGRNDCQRCHRSAVSFSDLSFRHDLDARFRLGKAHRQVACEACHKPFKRGKVQTLRYRPMRRRCVDCHGAATDPLRRRKR